MQKRRRDTVINSSRYIENLQQGSSENNFFKLAVWIVTHLLSDEKTGTSGKNKTKTFQEPWRDEDESIIYATARCQRFLIEPQ